MKRSWEKRLNKLEETSQPPEPSAICVRYEDESFEEALRLHREKTGGNSKLIISFNRKREDVKVSA
jgi:hypothetical protein